MRKQLLPKHWFLLLLGTAACIIIAFVFHDKLQEFRSLGLFGIFLANFFASATIFIPAPGIITVIAGGALYSPFLVGIIATIGACLGDMIGFLLGLTSRKTILHTKHKRYILFIKLFKKYGAVVIFVFAFVPNPVFDAIGIVAGALEYPWYTFLLWMFLGRLCRNLLLSFFGAALL